MFKKLLKKIILAATLVCSVGAIAATSGCNIETDHPEVKITVEFHEESYELQYTLYRNMYPNTVRHFIELTNNGFYNNLLVHDYTSSDWYSGGYQYVADEYSTAANGGAGAMTDYLVEHSVETSYLELFTNGKLASTVYRPQTLENGEYIAVKENALPTIIGEFYNNIKQEIEQGALTASYGSLKMFYYEKESTGKVLIKPTEDQLIPNAGYASNCATSLFMIQVSSSSTKNASDYCVFGRLNNSSVLTDLTDAVKEYLKTLTTSTVSANNVTVDSEIDKHFGIDEYVSKDFILPSEPIVIRSVKVTKY